MPVTTVQVRTTYTPEQELAIIEAVQTALVEGFKIPLRDIPLADWGLRGGQAACDVDLGFDLNV